MREMSGQRGEPTGPVIIDEMAAEEYLQMLALDRADLVAAIQDGHDAALNHADKFWPVTAAGTARWQSTVHTLRRLVDQSFKGWVVDNPHNRPVMQKSGSTYELAVAAGNSDTGNPDSFPDVHRAKGSATVRAVNRYIDGVQQPALIRLDTLLPGGSLGEHEGQPPAGTWLLLYHPAEDGIQSELSLPSEMSSEGRIVGWQVRVLLGTITRDQDGEHLPVAPDLGGGEVSFDFG